MQSKTRAQLFAERANPPELKYRADPVRWAIERAKVELWSKQREILEAVRDNPRVAIPSCHSAGKSFTMGLLTCWWLDTLPIGEARVISTAPTAKQVDAVLWNEINQHHLRIGLRGHTNKREWYFGRYLAGLGRKPPDHVEAAFQGLHALYLMVILDEAYGIPLHLWNEAHSLASNENARMVAIGNPDGSGEFEKICRPNSGWKVINISYEDTPNFTEEQISARLSAMLIGRDWVEDRRKAWGPDSALFQSKCAGKFPTEGSPWDVIPAAWANQCRWLELPVQNPVEAGIDIGAGNDRTVVAIRDGMRIRELVWFLDPDPMKTVARIAQCLRDNKVTTAKVDTIGIGWGIYGRLRELSSKNNPTGNGIHDADVIPINVAESPTPGNEERFINKRAEMWWDVGRENSRLRLWDFSNLDRDTQDQLIYELTLPQYEIMDSRGKIKIEPKEKIVQRLGASPDLAEALLLAYVPVNWTAQTQTETLVNAPSLLNSLSAFDAVNGEGAWWLR